MKRFFSLLLCIFFFLFVGGGCTRAPLTPEPTGVGANSVVISTHTATPNVPVSAETATPTLLPPSNSGGTGVLPGLSPVNVTVGLEGQNFTCTAVKKGTVSYERTCIKGMTSTILLKVIISGREPSVIDFIETSVLQSTDPDVKNAISLLDFMASLPYDGATPDEAKAWVESTIPTLKPGNTQESLFGGVKYVLHGDLNTLTLEMGELP